MQHGKEKQHQSLSLGWPLPSPDKSQQTNRTEVKPSRVTKRVIPRMVVMRRAEEIWIKVCPRLEKLGFNIFTVLECSVVPPAGSATILLRSSVCWIAGSILISDQLSRPLDCQAVIKKPVCADMSGWCTSWRKAGSKERCKKCSGVKEVKFYSRL